MEMPSQTRTLLAVVVALVLSGAAVYAVWAPPSEALPPVASEATVATTLAPPIQVVTEVVVDEADRAVAAATEAAGLAEFVTEEQLLTVLPPEVVRLLVDRGAVLEVPAGADLGLNP